MDNQGASNHSYPDVFELNPLLRNLLSHNNDRIRRNNHNNNHNNNNNIALFIRRATSRRIMREPSMVVRETAALQLEERQLDWGDSKPVVVLDIIWNFAFVIVSAVVLLSTTRERPPTPLRIWVIGYAIQCILHVGFIYFEYQRRNRSVRLEHNANESDEEDPVALGNRSR